MPLLFWAGYGLDPLRHNLDCSGRGGEARDKEELEEQRGGNELHVSLVAFTPLCEILDSNSVINVCIIFVHT